jgi:hypothetical protein
LNDTIVQLFYTPVNEENVSFSTAAFENLKNDGLSLISNDSLKINIINIYDQELNYIQTIFANQLENHINSVVDPFYSKHFEFSSNRKKIFDIYFLRFDTFLYLHQDCYPKLMKSKY